jgi:phosphotransferase system HPr (HPr) family protein
MKKQKSTVKKNDQLTRKVCIHSRQGLHARPAALFVQVASRFKSEIRVKKGKEEVDGKSIMGLLTLAASRGSLIILTAKGPDAEEALSVLEQLVSHHEVPAIVNVVRHKPGHGSHT